MRTELSQKIVDAVKGTNSTQPAPSALPIRTELSQKIVDAVEGTNSIQTAPSHQVLLFFKSQVHGSC